MKQRERITLYNTKIHAMPKTNEVIRRQREGASKISSQFIKEVIIANDYLLKVKGISRRQQERELKDRGLLIVENTYFALKRGSYDRINTMFLSILCDYWGLQMIAMLSIGLDVKYDGSSDITKWGVRFI